MLGHHCNTMVPLRSGPPQLWGSTFLVRRKHGWSVPQLEQSSEAIVSLLGWVGKGFPLWLMMGFKVIPKSKATHQSHVGTIWQALNLGKLEPCALDVPRRETPCVIELGSAWIHRVEKTCDSTYMGTFTIYQTALSESGNCCIKWQVETSVPWFQVFKQSQHIFPALIHNI